MACKPVMKKPAKGWLTNVKGNLVLQSGITYVILVGKHL